MLCILWNGSCQNPLKFFWGCSFHRNHQNKKLLQLKRGKVFSGDQQCNQARGCRMSVITSHHTRMTVAFSNIYRQKHQKELPCSTSDSNFLLHRKSGFSFLLPREWLEVNCTQKSPAVLYFTLLDLLVDIQSWMKKTRGGFYWFTRDGHSKMSSNELLLPACPGIGSGKTSWLHWNWGEWTFSELTQKCWQQMAGYCLSTDVTSLCQLGNEQHNLASVIFLTLWLCLDRCCISVRSYVIFLCIFIYFFTHTTGKRFSNI